MKIKYIMKNDKYMGIAQKLSEVAQAQQNLFTKIILTKIIQPSPLMKKLTFFRTIESTIKELDTVNSLKNMLPQEILKIQAIELARQANLAISGISISPLLESMVKEAADVSNLWKKQISSMSQLIETSLLGIQSQIARISEISLLAERSLIKIDFNNIGALVSASLDLKDLIKNNHISFSKSYAFLFESLAEKQSAILSYAPVVSVLPPIEFYNNNRFLKVISIPSKDKYREAALDIELANETNDELETILSLNDPSLIKLWRGAKKVLNSKNPDAVRHFATSLRELLTHVIHTLSPDNAVKSWSTLPEHYHNNKPTRKARLLFICRYINYGPFSTFLEKDIDALLACIDIFQEGTHAIDAPLTMSQLELLKNRVGSSIRLLIRIWRDTREN
jgi:hypothetical protein